jgi:hypothetical protein
MTGKPLTAAAAAFAADLREATEAYTKNPEDVSPFEELQRELQQRRKSLAQEIIRQTDGSTFQELGATIAQTNDGIAQIAAAEPLDQPKIAIEVLNTARQRLDDVAGQLDNSLRMIKVCTSGNSDILRDYEAFALALSELPATGDNIAALSIDITKSRADVASQSVRLAQMLTTSGEQAAAMTEQQKLARERIAEFEKAAQNADTFKDFIDSCSTGTRNAVKIKKPLTLRRDP